MPPVKTPPDCAGEVVQRRRNETWFDAGRHSPCL